jgi:CheY-like chemotaxis protein
MEKPSGEMAHGLEVIERNARAQTKLIEDLLDVSRISTGKLRLATRVVTVSSVVQAAAEAVKPTAAARGVEIVVDLPAEPLRLVADPDRLQQVVWNLMSNAVKFTPPGGRVTATAEQVGGQIEVRVTDTGQGIAPEFLPFVFDRFRQADSTSTRSHGGLGIGLTIVRHIVELHGGSVRADSRGEGHGSTFTVTLPITAASEADETPQPRPSRHGTGANGDAQNGDLSGLRVLVIDDAPDALDVLAVILRRAKADVTTAPSAHDGRRALQEIRPDLVISDIAMPDEDGYAFIRSLRALPPDRGGVTPAIALTAYAREEDRTRALAAGFQAHMSKPVEPDELIDLVARVAGANPAPALAEKRA